MRRAILIALLLALTPWSFSFAEEPFKVGDTVPQFRLPYATQDSVNFDGFGSADLKGQRYVIAFYPADWSSGCTTEMCTLRDNIADFENLHVTVVPISGDYVFTHRQWAKYQKFPFKLLSDPTRAFGKLMGVYRPDVGMMQRSVFVVGPDGRFEYIDYNYSVKDDKDYKALKAALDKETGSG